MLVSQSQRQTQEFEAQLHQREFDLSYVAPERLILLRTLELLTQLPLFEID